MNHPKAVAASVAFAPQETPLEALGRVADSRWILESGVEAAKGEVRLDDYKMHRWTGWYRLITLVMWAYALLTVLRAGALAVEALKKSAGAPAGEPAGRLQSRVWRGVPLSLQGIRRLLWHLGLAVQQTAYHLLT